MIFLLSRLKPKLFNRNFFSSSSKNIILPGLSSGGSILLDARLLEKCNIDITSNWQDECMIDSISLDNTQILKSQIDNEMTLIFNENPESSTKIIKLSIPEYLNIKLLANHLNLSLINKIQGDIRIKSNSGNIKIDKIRGEKIILDCKQSDISVKRLIEGNITVNCRNFQAKMINGKEVTINADDFIVNAFYGDKSYVFSKNQINIDLFKGFLNAKNEGKLMEVRGIDGTFELINSQGNIEIQVNSLLNSSNAIAPQGQIRAVIDPEAAAEIYCESTKYSPKKFFSTIVSENFLCKNIYPIVEIKESQSIFEGGKISGFLRSSQNASNKPFGDDHSYSGKINTKSFAGQKNKNEGQKLSLIAKGNVRVETMSWVQAIRKKYGL